MRVPNSNANLLLISNNPDSIWSYYPLFLHFLEPICKFEINPCVWSNTYNSIVNRTLNRQMQFARQPWVYSSRDSTKSFARSQFIQNFSASIVHIFIRTETSKSSSPVSGTAPMSIGIFLYAFGLCSDIQSTHAHTVEGERKINWKHFEHLNASIQSTCNKILFDVIDCSLHQVWESKTGDPMWPQLH